MKKRWRLLVLAAVALTAAVTALALTRGAGDFGLPGSTVGERLETRKAERAALQARLDGRGRLELLEPVRMASLLSDALAARADGESERAFERLSAPASQAFDALDALNRTLKDALARPGPGATMAAREAARRANAALEQLANWGEQPLVLSFTPRFVAPRRATGELVLAPRPPAGQPRDNTVRLAPTSTLAEEAGAPTVPRYAPTFAAPTGEEPPVVVEVVGLRLASAGHGLAPVLTVGAWRGEARIDGGRLSFAVPRSAFPTASARTTLVGATLAVRREGHTATFELPFVVLPDRPGSMAFDQKVRGSVAESNTLVSPEILARAGVGETRTLHRCFDPPEGWRFEKNTARVVVVERLAWVDDISDPTMNAGTVEFAGDGKSGQLCLNVVARPAAKTARTATIGRFEATLVRERAEDRTVASGVRALDWREPLRLAIEDGVVEWKLYVRLFDEIDRDFAGTRDEGKVADLPFLHIAVEAGGKTLVLTPDPAAEP